MKHQWKHSVGKLYEAYQSGLSLEQVGALEGLSSQPIRRLFRKHNLEIRKGGRPAGIPQAGRALTEEQQIEVVKLYEEGWSLAKLARHTGRSRSAIGRCLHFFKVKRRTCTPPSGLRQDGENIICIDCRVSKPADAYYNNSTAANGKMACCKDCSLLRNRRYAYGITEEQYVDLLTTQDGKCAGCGCGPESDRNRGKASLCVDHCHDTGRIRALLCVACNHLIGLAGDDPECLRRLADLLEEPACPDPLS